MTRSRLLNLGCGDKHHPDWVNIDGVARHPRVMAHDLRKGIPFEDGSFDVVYHSQVLEHITRPHVLPFLRECRRVLATDGTLRVVVPDLEGIAQQYLACLAQCQRADDEQAVANYDWMMLELLDQSVRHRSGGDMLDFLASSPPNPDFIASRAGRVARELMAPTPRHGASRLASIARAAWPALRRLVQSEASRIGRFRLGGEVHLWAYDRFSLGRLLRAAGFHDVTVVDPRTSRIEGWERIGLDVLDGQVCDPSSLFMEGRNP